MFGVRLHPVIKEKLEKMAKDKERSASYLVKKAIAEMIENHEDYLEAVKASEDYKKNPKSYTIEEVIKKHGLESKVKRKSRKTA